MTEAIIKRHTWGRAFSASSSVNNLAYAGHGIRRERRTTTPFSFSLSSIPPRIFHTPVLLRVPRKPFRTSHHATLAHATFVFEERYGSNVKFSEYKASYALWHIGQSSTIIKLYNKKRYYTRRSQLETLNRQATFPPSFSTCRNRVEISNFTSFIDSTCFTLNCAVSNFVFILVLWSFRDKVCMYLCMCAFNVSSFFLLLFQSNFTIIAISILSNDLYDTDNFRV